MAERIKLFSLSNGDLKKITPRPLLLPGHTHSHHTPWAAHKIPEGQVSSHGQRQPLEGATPALWGACGLAPGGGAGLGWWVGPKVHCTTFHAPPLQ